MDRHDDPAAGLDSHTVGVYRRAMHALARGGVPYLVGGAYALARHTGVTRHTKDFDVFVRPEHAEDALRALEAGGFRTELTFPHWLGKGYDGDLYIDVIYSSGNGVARVDDDWFGHAAAGEVLGVPCLLCPMEEMIWSKAWIMERERFDGADIAHMLQAAGDRFDWDRLVARFGDGYRVLLVHLMLYGFAFPADRSRIPARVMKHLVQRLQKEIGQPDPLDDVCQGTLLSRQQYLVDLEKGWSDARLEPRGNMKADEIRIWTDAISDEEKGDDDGDADEDHRQAGSAG